MDSNMIFFSWEFFYVILLPLISIVVIVTIVWSLYPKYTKVFIPLAVGLSLLTFLYFYTSVLLDIVQKAGIITGLLSPLVVYIYDTMKQRRDFLTEIERTVRGYIKTNIESDVNNLGALLEDIQQHQVIFLTKYQNWSNTHLSKLNYEKVNTFGILGYMPSLRINKYFYHVDSYNKLIARIESSDVRENDRLNMISAIDDINKSFSKLNELLYINFLYTIDRLQNNVLSFPTVDFPTRFSRPYLWLLLEAGLLGKVELKNGKIVRTTQSRIRRKIQTEYTYENAYDLKDLIKREHIKIYDESSAYKLMSFLGKRFDQTYNELEDKFNKYH